MFLSNAVPCDGQSYQNQMGPGTKWPDPFHCSAWTIYHIVQSDNI